MSKTVVRFQGLGFAGLLVIVLIALKIIGYNISWFWVFSPFIIIGGLTLFFILLYIICVSKMKNN